MIEYQGGNFGEMMSLKEALQELYGTPPEMVKALHIGTEEELKEVKQKKATEDRIKSLEKEAL